MVFLSQRADSRYKCVTRGDVKLLHSVMPEHPWCFQSRNDRQLVLLQKHFNAQQGQRILE
ncbi:unnamed protein product, partial [Sphenostylis stenocarpa]